MSSRCLSVLFTGQCSVLWTEVNSVGTEVSSVETTSYSFSMMPLVWRYTGSPPEAGILVPVHALPVEQ